MEFYLVENQEQNLQLGTTNRLQILKCQVKIRMIKNASSIASNNIFFDKFQNDFAKKFGTEKEWTVVAQISSKKPGPSSRTSSSEDKECSLKGDLLKELQQYFHGNNKKEQLQVEVNAECFRVPNGRPYAKIWSSQPRHRCRIRAGDFTPRVEASGFVDHTWYVQRGMVYSILPSSHTVSIGDRWIWSTTIKIKVFPETSICLDDILPKTEDTVREIFETKKFPDFTIISEDGTRIPCHKVFLAKSPVLTQMFEGGFEEARTNEMTIGDMTTQGVNALLEFLYCGTINHAMTQCDIAFELLKAADMYDLQVLWKAMTSIVSTKPQAWFDVDVALRLFVFVRQCERDESKSLMKKMMQVVGMKPEQLSRSSAFLELFPSKASQDMFLAALTTSRS